MQASSLLTGWRKYTLAHNAGWMLLGQVGNFLLQAIYFVVLARLLGVREYGVFAGAISLVNIVAPYSSLGSGMLFMRYVTADRSRAGVYWGNMLAITTIFSGLLAAALAVVGPEITHVHNVLIFLLLVPASCCFTQITNCASTVFQTFEKMNRTAGLQFIANLSRLVVVLVMLFTLRRATVVQWCFGVLAATGAAAIVALIMVRLEVGPSSVDGRLALRRLGEGFGFSFAGTTQSIYNDVDKTMMAHFGMFREDGFYTLAYRIVDFSTAPIAAIDLAVLPRYFQLGHRSIPATAWLAVRSTVIAVGIGLAISLCIFPLAPVVPRFVGHDFTGVIAALRLLCWLPAIRAVHRLIGGVLTATGHQNARTFAQLCVGGFNLLVNLWCIPKYGWIGAAWSSLASDGLLAILNTLLVVWVVTRTARKREPASASLLT